MTRRYEETDMISHTMRNRTALPAVNTMNRDSTNMLNRKPMRPRLYRPRYSRRYPTEYAETHMVTMAATRRKYAERLSTRSENSPRR